MSSGPKIHFVTNGIFSTSIAGGDMVFFNLAHAAASAGYDVNYFGGHAFQQVFSNYKLPGRVVLTDKAAMSCNRGGISGQFSLFRDFFCRYRGTMQRLKLIEPDDFICAASDYWFDVIPVVRSISPRKLMVLNMEAPGFGEILTRGRPDVDILRLASLHYWASQEWSLRRFAGCRSRHMVYLHPLMEPRLDHLGIGPEERTLISYGLDPAAADAVPAQERIFDAVWLGRVHRQKGVDDLLATLEYLAGRIENFRVLFIGNLEKQLRPELNRFGLGPCATFSGYVTEEEKIRLFKASRVFLMPSKHEGSPRVIGESIIARTPVVAYEIPNYRPLFGDFVRYAPPFDLNLFRTIAEREIMKMRTGDNYLGNADLRQFKAANSWQTAGERFLAALEKLRLTGGRK